MRLSNTRRAGLTLVELIVVVAIVAILATITALYFPRFQEQEQVNRGADMLQGWLLIAKQQARRDGVPTGIRFKFEADPSDSNKMICRTMEYIQQPANFAQGQYWRRFGGDARIAEFKHVNLMDPTAGTEVREGDYIEILGKIRRVMAPTGPTQLPLHTSSADLPLADFPDNGPGASPNYRILPQPRPITGEQTLQLPEDIGIVKYEDIPRKSIMGSRAVPVRNTTFFEIVFGTSGALVGEGSGGQQVIFWVSHLAPNIDKATLITVQPRTGFIAAHPVASSGDRYQFTTDARSSGM